jgi:GGDEF domain-containing protein
MAHHDGLTNLPNRELYQERLKEVLENGQASNQRLAVLCLDLDLFNTNPQIDRPM